MTPFQTGLERLISSFQSLGVRFLIGGSLASSAYGEPRPTADVDLLADLRLDTIDPLSAELRPEFYLDPTDAREALRRGRSFNVFHIQTATKFDIFPARTPFHQLQLQRAIPAPILGTEPLIYAPVATAEDILLAKLLWFREGGEVSERQWRDVLGIIAVKGGELDREYLTEWATRLGVADLLGKLLA